MMEGVEEQISITVDDYETMEYDSDCESSGFDSEQFKIFSRNGMVRLEESETKGNNDHSEHSVIKKSFLVGMGFHGKEINVVAVHKNSYSSVTGQAKKEAFRVFSQAAAVKRGDANIKYAWYGGSRDEICDIIAYGFGRCRDFEKGVSHGIGVHLSPANIPIDSALRAVGDENGVRHMLLCRVILGNTEIIPAGSEQFHPSSTHFDSGIDNPLAPRKYIIWSAYMNSHIFPNYVISFHAPSLTAKKPNSPSMKLPVLLNLLSRILNHSKMGLILNYYSDFRENKIHRSQFIEGLRSLAGDKMLISVIKLCRDEVNY